MQIRLKDRVKSYPLEQIIEDASEDEDSNSSRWLSCLFAFMFFLLVIIIEAKFKFF